MAFGFGTPPPAIDPGQTFPNSSQGDNPILMPQPAANTATRQSFMPPNYMAPYYNAAGVAGNLGTMLGGAAPAAANFMQGMFDPNLNQMESSFMGASLGNALRGMDQGFQRQEAQFEGQPGHSGLFAAQGDVMEQAMRDLMQTGSQMGLQREQLAAGMSQFPFTGTMEMANQPVQLQSQMYNQLNNAWAQPYQEANTVYSGIPVSAPAVIANQGSGK